MDESQCESYRVGQFRSFFMCAIDLGYLVAEDSDQKQLQKLRSLRSVSQIFLDGNARNDLFINPVFETGELKRRADEAAGKKGKRVWSKLFLDDHAPIIFEERVGEKFSDSGVEKNAVYKVDASGTPVQFKYCGCNLRVTRSGTLLMTFEFLNQLKEGIPVGTATYALKALEDEVFLGFKWKIDRVLKDWSQPKSCLSKLEVTALSDFDSLGETLRTASMQHLAIFIEGFIDKDGELLPTETDDAIRNQVGKELLGILNKADWYEKYSKAFVEDTFRKNVGYRRDEIYITDKNVTLVYLKDYWVPGNALELYMPGLVLVIAMQIACHAFLHFFQTHIQKKTISPLRSRSSTWNEEELDSVDLILKSRNILQLAEEALDVSSMISHGFARRVARQLMDERHVHQYLERIRSRTTNLSDAIALKTSVSMAKRGIDVSRIQVNIALGALVFTGLLAIVSLILRILSFL